MKADAEIRKARKVINANAIKPGLSERQQILLMGMSVALCWVQDEGGGTLQELLDGRPMARRPEGPAGSE